VTRLGPDERSLPVDRIARRELRENLPHWVYRCHDQTGRLIYVGCTWDLTRRLTAIRATAWWADQIVKVRASVYSGKARARGVERKAIVTEHPRWNTQNRWPSHRTWTEDQFRDYVYASFRFGHSTLESWNIVQVYEEYERRFGHPLRDERIDPYAWERPTWRGGWARHLVLKSEDAA
jgi:hypothetical protein